jgi:geranylgeranyl diphosphate synthase type I
MTPAAFDRYMPLIQAEMRRAVGNDPARLYGMVRYHLGWEDREGRPSSAGGGKALRPVLCLLVCEALCGDPRPALPAAAGIELLHNFSLVHDDIEDGDETRRGRATAWTLWGEPQAINAGDGLWALSTRTLLNAVDTGAPPDTVVRAMRILNDASLRMIEGQAADLEFESAERVTTDEYLRMIAGKTGALITASVTLGALFAGADPWAVAALVRYGEEVGRIFQIHDDVLGVWGEEAVTGKSAGNDLRRKKKSFPVLHGLTATNPAAREFAALYARPELDDSEIARASSLLDEAGAREAAARLCESAFQRAVEALTDGRLPESARTELEAMGRFLLTREK